MSSCHSLTSMVTLATSARLAGERGQLVIVRREQGTAAVCVVQVLDRRPGDGQAVERRGAAADLVEDDNRSVEVALIQDVRRLDHLDHERRAAARDVVGGADAREQPVDDADA